MYRRSLLQGFVALLASLALPCAAPAFDERELLRPFDPKVKGVRWQSWPWGLPRPDEFATGSMEAAPGERRALSYFAAKVERYRHLYPELDFEPIV